jgi:hypothetical protein
VAYQKVYAPQLSRELILRKDGSNIYVLSLNIAVLVDFATFFNFLIWILFDLPNQIAIKTSIPIFGKESALVFFLQRVRNRIFQHLSIKLLKNVHVFPNSHK